MTGGVHTAAIVGGGFSGIGAAIRLDQAGFEDLVVLEEGDDVGGAWHWNTYPGVAVDIPSFSYQFSFEKRADWSRVYASGPELRAYARDCVDKYGLRSRIRLGTKVVGASFDDSRDLWRLETAAGDSIAARHVIGATGVFSQPKWPEIRGLDAFAGKVMHTARWDHTHDLRGRRVAVVGTGASAVQVIPAIAPHVEQLTVFQRTPIWCLPRADARIGRLPRLGLRLRAVAGAARVASEAFVEATLPLPAHFHGLVPIARAGERVAHDLLQRQVADREMRERLTPRYPLGCKRPGFSNDYLPAFNRPNVALETGPIEAVGERSIRTAGGAEHEVDTIVLATGFKVFESGNMPPFPVHGSGGVDLEDWWDENRFQAYEGVSVPGFPNFFLILGPYGYNGSSYFNLIENQARHIVRCLRRAAGTGATRIEVRPEANERYFKAMLARRRNQIFFREDCSAANSYYFDRHGDAPFRPAATLEAAWRSARFDLGDYSFSAAG